MITPPTLALWYRLRFAAVAAMIALAGCAAAPVEHGYLAIPASHYHEVFDAANEVARTYGLAPALQDRRAGIIETHPAIAGSLLEPWHPATRSLEQAAASTVSFQRRRARFEFRPAGVDWAALAEPGDEPHIDLTDPEAIAQGVELRVWVYNERAHVPGIRRSDWSRRLTTRASVVNPETGETQRSIWTVVARDRALEEHLLGRVSRIVAR